MKSLPSHQLSPNYWRQRQLAPLAAAASTTTTPARDSGPVAGNAQSPLSLGLRRCSPASNTRSSDTAGCCSTTAAAADGCPVRALRREAPSPARSAHRALAKPAGRRWRTLGSGPPDRAGHLRNRFRCRHRESMWRLALRGRRQGFCRGRIRRRNGCPVPPNHSPPRRHPRCSISIARLSR